MRIAASRLASGLCPPLFPHSPDIRLGCGRRLRAGNAAEIGSGARRILGMPSVVEEETNSKISGPSCVEVIILLDKSGGQMLSHLSFHPSACYGRCCYATDC